MFKKYKSIDMYGKHIALTYKGEETFKTTVGALVSCIVIAIILVWTVSRFYIMFNFYNTSIQMNRLSKSHLEMEQKMDLGLTDFNFGVKFSKELEENFAEIEFNLVTSDRDPLNPDQRINKRRSPILLDTCQDQ